MKPPTAFSAVLATYNRAALLRRAVESVLAQGWPELEILVVDDGSDEPAAKAVADLGPRVRVLRQPGNLGVNAARNRGIAEARHPWVLIFDDDDVLLPGALQSIADAIAQLAGPDQYPVLNFGSTNSEQLHPFEFVTPRDYLCRRVRGDLIPVIQREVFLSHDLAYPETGVGGEHLLWLQVAAEHTIPSWNIPIVRVSDDAVLRLTSARTQAQRADEHAQLQEETLARFGPLLAADYPRAYRRRHLAAATYWLLAGERGRALAHSAELAPGARVLVRLAAAAPRRLVANLFLLYRRVLSGI